MRRYLDVRYLAIVAMMCLLAVGAVGQTVTVVDSAFNSSSISITAGQTVTWTWGGGTSLAHNVVSGSSCTPDGIFNSGATKTSGTFGHTFTVAGTYNYYCDPHCGFMTGSVTVNPAAATSLSLSAPGSATAGVAFNVTVTAFDTFGNVATGFGGTVSFTSNDGAATLPSGTLINGSRTFSVTMRTSGTHTLQATASGVSSSGTAFINVSPAATSKFVFSGTPASVTAGTSFSATVTAEDAFNNVTPSYAGTVHLSSTSDPIATFPANNTLVSGVRTFTGITLKTAGTQTITGTDTLNSGITGTSGGITVNPGPATHFGVTAPPSAFVGLPFNITVTALDQFGNQATPAGTAYTGTVHFTSSDSGAVLPANYTFVTGDSGVHNFSVTLNTINSQTVTATDTITGSITGNASITVRPPCPAAPRTFTNSTPINFSTTGHAGVSTTAAYPSQVTVSGMTGTIGKLTLALNGFSVTACPAALALMLQGPHGQFLIPMSLVGQCNTSGGSGGFSGLNVTIDDSASSPLPQYSLPLTSGTYRPGSYLQQFFPAAFQSPAPAGPYSGTQIAATDGTGTFANAFNGTDPNGTWNLYILYQNSLFFSADSGSLASWSLTITPQFTFNGGAITINDVSPATPYPSPITVSGLAGRVTKMTMTVNNFSHTFPHDVGMLLVGPLGQKMVVMSDAGGNGPGVSNVTFTLDDAATAVLPNTNFTSGTYQPADYLTDTFPASGSPPAPGPPYSQPQPVGAATFASVFNASDANGNWYLYVLDDAGGDVGTIGSWNLTFQTDCPAGTNCTVNSSANPSVFGQNVAETGTVSSISGTPFSPPQLNFLDGVSNFGIINLNGSGQAVENVTTFTVGTHPITINYPGNTTFASCSSATLNQVVNKDNTTTSVISSVNPSVFGQSVTFTATVSANAPGAGTATGSVTFMDGVTTLGTVTLSSGVATFPTSALSVGSHSITVTYNGDGNFNVSTSVVLTQVVNKAPTNSFLGTSGSPSIFGNLVTFTASVTVSAPAAGTPSGTVTFNDGGSPIGTTALNGVVGNDQATFSTSTLTVGSHTITASYNGDGNFNISTSGGVTQTVSKGTTTSSVGTSGSPSIFGNSVMFTATVAVATGAGTPSGTVTFKDGSTTLGTGTLNGVHGNDQATFSTSALTVGGHTITAVYAGDGNFTNSTSSGITQTVNQGTTTATVGTSGSPTVLGVSVTFTATVNVATGAGIPSGSVTFMDGATTLGTGTLNGVGGNDQATFSTSTLSVGDHSITATYVGDTNFSASSQSAPITQTVTQATPTANLVSGTNPSLLGNSVIFTATLGSAGGVFPTGSVLFLDGASKLGSGPINGSGVATFTTSNLALGSHSMTASYGGDTNFLNNTSNIVTQVVNPKAVTNTTVVSSLNPALFKKSVTLTATVTATGSPTGTVTFWDGANSMATVALDGTGHASYMSNQWKIGSHQITAVYNGDFNFAVSTSSVLLQLRSPKPH